MTVILFPVRTGDLEQISETINIENMYFCHANSSINADNKKLIEIQMIYAAHTDKGETVVFVQHLQEDLDVLSSSGSMVNGGFFEAEGFLNDHIFRQTTFFLGERDGVVTDFNYTFNKDTRRYEFFGFESGKCKRFSINRTIAMGLDIMNRCSQSRILDSNSVREINVWITNDNKDRQNAEFDNVESFRILDISKSVKRQKGMYMGVVAIEFTVKTVLDIEKTYRAVMSYFRSKPLRKRNITKDISLMEVLYSDAYTIGSYMGQSINPNNSEARLFGRDQSGKYVIFNMTTEKHSEFTKLISNFG